MANDNRSEVVLRYLVHSSISNYVGTFITMGAWFLLTPFMLQQLGTTVYGLWVLVGSVTAYGLLLDLGITGALTKYIAEYRVRGETEQARSLIVTALCFYCALGLTVVALSAAIAHAQRILRPSGVLFVTVPSVSRVVPNNGLKTDYWRFTAASCSSLFAEVFGIEQVTIRSFGNVLTAIGS